MELLAITFWWYLLVPAAFIAFVAFINVDSAWSDAKKGRRGLLIGAGVLLTLAAIGFLIMVTKNTN